MLTATWSQALLLVIFGSFRSDIGEGMLNTKPEWTPLSKIRSHEHVISEIERQLLTGHLHPGDRLPAERELAKLLGVGRGAVREALRTLEALGILTAHAGSGSDAGSVLAAHPSEAMTLLLRLHLALSGFTVDDIMETRIVLEGWAARSAARHPDTSALQRADHYLALMTEPHLHPARFLEYDARFHVALADASGNHLVSYLMQSLREAIREHMEHGFPDLSDPSAVMATLLREHQEIYELICAGEGDRAAGHIEHHIRSFYAAVQSNLK